MIEPIIKNIEINNHKLIKQVGFANIVSGIEIPILLDKNVNSFDLKITFTCDIKKIRLANYTWRIPKQNIIIPEYSNKIIQLENGLYFQPETAIGIWEINKAVPNTLLWRFNPIGANKITSYKCEEDFKHYENVKSVFGPDLKLKLLFSKNGALEISRSKIPFSSIMCFTDHCDFDTPELLVKQRIFFNKNNIRTTKGFFLNHFSKRNDNASWKHDQSELSNWVADGHELCYHSLSQSLKSDEESFQDFKNFTPPIPASTWIDHGYQPYNLSLLSKSKINENDYATILKSKKINILWNYVDSGTATSGVINQLNPNDFTLKSFWKGIRNKSLKQKISLFIKNAIVHYYADENLIRNYTQLASGFKKIIKTKAPKDLYKFIKASSKVIVPLAKIIFGWKKIKNTVYPNAKYSPVFFEHTIGQEQFIIFQTLELLDFKNALDKPSIDKFIAENGLFIGHTYFAVPMKYHDGKIFDNQETINPIVESNFCYIAQKIENNQIWNPTLVELVAAWKDFTSTKIGVVNQEFVIIQNNNLPFRKIT